MPRRLHLGPLVFIVIVSATILGWLGIVSVLALDLICLGAMALAVFSLPMMAGARPHNLALGVGIVTVTLVALRLSQPGIRFMPYLLIFPANVLASYIFARGLLPGREPMLLSLIKLMGRQSIEDPEFIAFVRGQCLFWAVMTLLTGVVAALCIPLGQIVPEITISLGCIVALQLIWFPLSHIYANWRYNRVETFWNTIAMIGHPETRALLSLR